MVKIPLADAGIPAIDAMTAAGRSIHITLIFSLTRYNQVIDAYMSGLETLLARGGDPTRTIHIDQEPRLPQAPPSGFDGLNHF